MSDLRNLHELLTNEISSLPGKNIELMFAGFIIDERVIAKIISPIAQKISRIDLVFGPSSKRSPGFLSYYLKDRLNLSDEESLPVVNRAVWVTPLKKIERSGIFHSKYLFIFERNKKSNKRVLKALFLGSMNWSVYHFKIKDCNVLESFIKVDIARVRNLDALLTLVEFSDMPPKNKSITTSAKIVEFREDTNGISLKILKREDIVKQPAQIDLIAAPFITKGGVKCLMKDWNHAKKNGNSDNITILGPRGRSFRLHGKFIIGTNDSFIIFGSANITESALDGINHETIYYKNSPGPLKELRKLLSNLAAWNYSDTMEKDDEDLISGEMNLPKTSDGYLRDAKLFRLNDKLVLDIYFNGKKPKTRRLKLLAGKLDGNLEFDLSELPQKIGVGKISIVLPLQGSTQSEVFKGLLRKSLSNGILYLSMINENFHIPVDLGEFWIGPDRLAPAQNLDESKTKVKTKPSRDTANLDINWNGTDIRPLRVLDSKTSDALRWIIKILRKNDTTDEPSWIRSWREDPWLRNSHE